MENKNNNSPQRKPTSKGTWILLIILSFVVIGIAIYQMRTGQRTTSITYLIIVLSVLVIIASTFNLLRRKKRK